MGKKKKLSAVNLDRFAYKEASHSDVQVKGLFLRQECAEHPQFYGGKITAALRHQHPRDLFDCKYGITSKRVKGVPWFSPPGTPFFY